MIFTHLATHLLVLIAFAGMYSVAFRYDHFSRETKTSSWDPLFYACCTHTLLNDSTTQPITTLSKALTSAHAIVAFSLTIVVVCGRS